MREIDKNSNDLDVNQTIVYTKNGDSKLNQEEMEKLNLNVKKDFKYFYLINHFDWFKIGDHKRQI